MYLVSRTETFAKLFFVVTFSGLLMYIALAFYSFHSAFSSISRADKAREAIKKFNADIGERSDKDLKYILLWTIPETNYSLTIDGQQLFINNNCSHLNCYITTNKDLLSNDVSNFDAIVFSITTLRNWRYNMPAKRSPKQKYVFFSMTSADKFPVCNIKADSFFNWTWSYKLYSDIVTPFIEVRDTTNEVVAPKLGLNWNEKIIRDMEKSMDVTDFDSDFDNIAIGNKTKAVMWYMDKCDKESSDNTALIFAIQLKRHLKENNLTLDIYGCGFKDCPKEGCMKALERDYYFYLAHEGIISEDYVTTEVLKAFHHNAVPIVVGGADYPKFLPFESYMDATHESMDMLAALISYTIRSPKVYKQHFAWKKYFTIHETKLQRGYCDLCQMLNDKKKVERSTSYEHFRKWWFYGSLKERCLPKGAESFNDVLSYVKTEG